MDVTAVLDEIDSWTFEERLQLLEEVWNGLIDQGYNPDLTETQREDLDRRIADADAKPGEVFSSEDVRRYARERP